jgi:alkylated DNA nucleotide flippase Atl1
MNRTVRGSTRRGARARKADQDKSGAMLLRIERAIRAIPRGRVSTYGAIARTAGFPGAARQVAAILRRSFGLPWQRVLGAGGEIKLRGDAAIEQRLRLEAEGVRFHGGKVDMKAHEFKTAGSAGLRPARQPRSARPRSARGRSGQAWALVPARLLPTTND